MFESFAESLRLIVHKGDIMKKPAVASLILIAAYVFWGTSVFAKEALPESGGAYTFDVAFSSVTSQEIKGSDGVTYRLYSCEGCQFLAEPGKPKVPFVRKFVAIPEDAQDIKVSLLATSGKSEMLSKPLCPAPRAILKKKGNITYIAEQFSIDKIFYNSEKEFYPQRPATIAESGSVRGLRYVAVDIYPLQYQPADKVLKTNESMTVRLTWRSATGKIDTDKKESLKGLAVKILNYAEPSTGGREGPAAPNPVVPGGVVYPEPSDFAHASNQADYLIITADEFYGSPYVSNLANHRATYSGFNVAVVRASDIYTAVPGIIPSDPQLSDIGDDRDLKIKTFIKYVYEHWDYGVNALCYVLLVGDAYPETTAYYLPVHETVLSAVTGDGIDKNLVSDYWYTTLNDDNYSGIIDDYDSIGDLMLGRFSVQTAQQLQSVVEKTINFELYPPQYPAERWGSRILLTSGFEQGGLGSHMPAVRDFLLPYHREINEVDVRYTGTDAVARQAMKDHVNQVGEALWIHNGHGWAGGWRIGGEYSAFTIADIGTLYNDTMFPVIFSLACSTGEMDHPDYQSFGEQFISAQEKGAVAFLGATRVVGGDGNNELIDSVVDTIFNSHDYILGSDILQGKLGISISNWQTRHAQSLFGDPALDLSGVLGDYVVDKAEFQCSLINFAANSRSIKFGARVKNTGLTDAIRVPIQLYQNHPFQGGVTVPMLTMRYVDIPAQTEISIFPEVLMNGGWMNGSLVDFYFTVDTAAYMQEASVDELCETNNVSGKMQFFSEPFSASLVGPGTLPAVYGNKIAWIENSNNQYNVFLYDLGRDNIFLTADDGGKFQITSDGFLKYYPAIYGNKIIWRDSREGGSIRMYDLGPDGRFGTLDDGGESVVTHNLYDPQSPGRPSIYGDKIVYQAYRGSNWDIYLYNIATGSEIRITDESAYQQYPSIYRNMIVWQDYRNGNWDIYLYDLSTGNERRITTHSAHQQYPVIYGNKIAWQDSRNDAGDIYAYDLGTGVETQITSAAAEQWSPAISGSKLVWDDRRNGGRDLYLYDFNNPHGGEVRLTANPDDDMMPRIFDDKTGMKCVYQNSSKVFLITVSGYSPGGDVPHQE